MSSPLKTPSVLQPSTGSANPLEDASLEKQKTVIPTRQLEALYALGYELYSASYFEKAADLFRLLCIYEPENARNWIALGGASQHKKDHEAATAAFLMASFLDPLNPESRLYAAHSFIDMMDLPASLESAQAALDLCEGKADKQEIKKRASSLLEALKNL